MGKYRYLFFDLDNTILDFEKCEISALKRTFDNANIRFDDDILKDYLIINNDLWKKHDLGILQQREVLVGRFDILFHKMGVSVSPQVVSDKYQECLSETAFFEEEALDVILALYQSFELFIVSNGNTNTQRSRIERARLNKFFKGIFISEEIGFHKPQREFFEKCFLNIKEFSRGNALIIGDSLSSDILGGINADIHTCWYNPKAKEKNFDVNPDYEITRMSKILEIVEM